MNKRLTTVSEPVTPGGSWNVEHFISMLEKEKISHQKDLVMTCGGGETDRLHSFQGDLTPDAGINRLS